MRICKILMVWVVCVATQTMVSIAGSAYYVDAAKPDDSGDGLSWATAKQTIQAAVDLSATSDTVWVTDGTYNIGGAAIPAYESMNRVMISKDIIVQSVNGPDATLIVGEGPLGNDAVRGVYMSAGTLSGFTITNGYTRTTARLISDLEYEGSGGGVNLRGGDGIVTNCVIIGNTANRFGGGSTYGTLHDCILAENTAPFGGGSGFGILNDCSLTENSGDDGGGCYKSTLNRCVLRDNSASNGGGCYGYESTLNYCLLAGNSANFGGGSCYSTLNNCTLRNNSANSGGGSRGGYLYNCSLAGNSANTGGGSFGGTLNNCTLSGNSATSNGGGVTSGALNNCIVWGNSAGNYNDIYSATAKYSCASDITAGVNGCITNDPFFVYTAIGRFDLLANSPCIDAGNNIYASGDTDLAGNPRVVATTIDMGAYESPDFPSYTITTTIEGIGSMAPSNPMVFEGYDQPISILPSLGYYVESLVVDGTPIAVAKSYTFNDVQTSHTIEATFTTDPHALTVEKGTGDGSYIIWTDVAVVADAAKDGYVFLRWTTEPASYNSSLSDPYSATTIFTMPETNVVLTANYEPYICYVDATQSDDSDDGLSWETAKQTIQAAVDMVTTNGTVWVTNGTYNIGGAVAMGQSLTNRVCIDKAITVQSINGPEFTIIEGAHGSNGSNDVDSVRGVYIADGATLSGFTVTNGYTTASGGYDTKGGGLFMAPDGMATNCILIGNSAHYGGGGSYYGTLSNCTLSENSANNYGGGAYRGTLSNCMINGNSAGQGGGSFDGTLNNCRISGNLANDGGGAHYGTLNNCRISGNSAANRGGGSNGGTLNNCTLSGNSAASRGGGTYYGTLNNCIVWGNSAASYKDTYNAYAKYSCASDITAGVNGCITNAPFFINREIGRFDLLAHSPCINAGTNTYAYGDSDLAGNPRIVAGTIDMGAYEAPDLPSYSITTAVGENGSIVPPNPMVFEGYNQPVSMLPSLGYYVDSLTVDGTPVTPSESYTFNDVQTTHTIAVTFTTDPHALTVNNGTGGGSYLIWTEVNVVAATAPGGLIFRRWTAEPTAYLSGLNDPYKASTTFTMPETSVVLTAHYGSAYYADASQSNDSGDGLSWATAKQTIQAAVELADDIGCTVWVTNGTYNIGGTVAPGQSLTNRVYIDKAMTVQSVNGPEFTIIEGASGSNGELDIDAMRGVYIADDATLSGFTITNGYTMASGGDDAKGGGLFMETDGIATSCWLNGNSADSGGGTYNGTLNNCTLSGNSADYGGGSHSGTLKNCTLIGNLANLYGGGANNATLNACMLIGNSARGGGGGSSGGMLTNCTLENNSTDSGGGGAYNATLSNCTLTGNVANYGGGSYRGTLNNCIVWGNFADSNNDIDNATANYSCASDITAGVNGCITNEPYFVNSAIGRFDLLANSPCINVGNNVYASGDTDQGGNPRIVAGTIDMGAYESPDVSSSYLISTAAGENGVLVPSNPMAFAGLDQPMAIIPSPGYYVAALIVDGTPVTADKGYTFSDVQTTHSIAATFAIAHYALTVESGTGDGSYTIWPEISVVADPAPSGLVFRRWMTEPAQYSSSLADPYKAATTFRMPEANVILTAKYGPAYYVDAAQPNDFGDGLSWATAKQTIQTAVELADETGCTVLVAAGTYNIGGAVAEGQSLTNRVYLDKVMTVQSVNGPEVTFIEGTSGGNGGHDVDSVRGVYIADGATLSGFTITNGYTMAIGNLPDQKGGGIFMEPDGVATNCTIIGNSAFEYGGGVYDGTLNDCAVVGNSVLSRGGGTCYGTLNNCILDDNSANYGGGGAYYGTLNRCLINGNATGGDGGGTYFGTQNNCTVSGNTAADDGGGAYRGTQNNCTLSGNTAASYGGGAHSGTLNNCIVWGNTARRYWNTRSVTARNTCASDITAGVNGNISNDPLFVDAANGDYTLQTNSPCINAGMNSYVIGSTDLAGGARIVYGVVDMGAYEFSGAISSIPDFDNDGIADTWEGNYFGSTSGCDPDGHDDSDPLTNLEEYIAGTDPTDAASLFQTTYSGQIVDGFLVEWNAVSNRLYSVYRATNLTNSFQILETGIAYPQSSYTDTNAMNNAKGYYRLKVQLQE